MSQYPDEELPTETWSLQEFVNYAEAIIHQGAATRAIPAFVKFALAGRISTAQGEKRINIDVFKDCISLSDLSNITLTRDFDSLIGVTTNLPFRIPLAVYPAAPFRDSLAKSNHLKKFIHLSQWDRPMKVDLHKIPNICLSTAELRQKTLVFFPHMYQRGEDQRVTSEELEMFYDNCLRPAVATVLPQSISHWPVNYRACLMSMRDERQQFHFSRHDIPPHLLSVFCDALRNNLDRHTYFKNSFFVHEWRGTKSATLHSPEDTDACDQALEDTFKIIDRDNMFHAENEWYIDIGLEIQSPDLVLQWRTSCHQELLQYALPHAAPEKITSTVDGSRFKKDISSLLYDLSGFRVEVPTVGAEDYVQYVNVYTTDKSATYQLHRGSFRRHRAEDLLPHRMGGFLKDIETLGNLYDTCSGNGGVKQEGAARYEVRLKAIHQSRHPAHKLRDMRRDLINSAVVGFDPTIWWKFRWWRLAAVKYVFEALTEASPQLRVLRPVLGMGAIAIWIKNSHIFRPGEQSWDNEIVSAAALWEAEAEADDDENLAELDEIVADGRMVPTIEQRGLYFVSDVRYRHDVFALPEQRTLNAASYALIYNRPTFPELELLFMQSSEKAKRKLSGPTRKRRKVPSGPPRHSPERDIDFGLADAGVSLRPLLTMSELPHEHGDAGDVDREVNGIWHDFLRDIVAVIPRSKKENYCTLPHEEQNQATENLYQSSQLPFRCAIVKTASPSTWETTFFNRFFPTTDMQKQRPKTTYHYGSCSYWTRWLVLTAKVRIGGQKTIRGKLLVQFRELTWLPWSSSDRIWATGSSDKGTYIKLPEGYRDICPKIAINERREANLANITL